VLTEVTEGLAMKLLAMDGYPADNLSQKLLTERFNKDERIRLNRYHRKQSYCKEANQQEVISNTIEESTPTQPESLLKFRKKKQPHKLRKCIPKQENHVLRLAPDIDKSSVKFVDMRPASPITRSQLYDGLSYDKLGRHQYLRRRYELKPEDKFKYPYVSSWEHGWCLSEYAKEGEYLRPPTYGRTRIVKESFFTGPGGHFRFG